MKFLIDAQLPHRLCDLLALHSHDAVHTLSLPDGNATKDSQINPISLDEKRVVVSKDIDFFYSHVLQGRPWKLLLIKTGNISARDLCALDSLESHSLVEMDRADVTALF